MFRSKEHEWTELPHAKARELRYSLPRKINFKHYTLISLLVFKQTKRLAEPNGVCLNIFRCHCALLKEMNDLKVIHTKF